MTLDNLLKEISTSKEGLTSKEASLRLERYGENRLKEERRTTPSGIFINQFRNVLILILIGATAVSFAIGEITDAATILAIIVLNAILGFYQEYRAERAIEALKRMLSPKARVMRDGIIKEIDSALLVPGDVVVLEMGEKVPADVYLIEAGALQVNEASLTGESVPVNKMTGIVPEKASLAERKNMLFMGTIITNGYGKGIVVATGMHTELGKIAKLTQEVGEEETPLKRRLDALGRKIGEISLLIAVAIGILGIIQQREIVEMFLVGVSLAVAVIPEGLLAVVTMTLALGVKNMVKRNCLIRHLMASETLGAASVICTDKTGTLTRNEMAVVEIFIPYWLVEVTGEGYEPRGEFLSEGKTINPKELKCLYELLEAGLLCNHAVLEKSDEGWTIVGEPTEGALVVAANKAEIFRKDIMPPLVTEFSFSSIRKRMTVIYHYEDRNTAYTKGAPEVILERSAYYCTEDGIKRLGEKGKQRFLRAYEKMAERGLIVLAFAYRELPR